MNLVLIKQLPILEEQIKVLSTEIQAKIDNALALKCTEESKTKVKSVRADLRKTFTEYEDKRKDVKNKIMKPYNDFEALYKVHISNKLNAADGALKAKIDEIENSQKAEKEKEVKEFFDEYLTGTGIDFLTFQDARINVTLSASVKALKDQAKDFIDRIASDLLLIDTQENKAEILVEYKKALNVSQAITTVSERHKAIEQEKEKVAEVEQVKEVENEVVKKVEAVAPPTADSFGVLTVILEKYEQLLPLENFLNIRGYKYTKEVF